MGTKTENKSMSVEKAKLTDNSLICGAQKGDEAAFGELFNRYVVRTRRLLISVVGPTFEIDDLVQEVFFGVYKSLHRFRGDSQFSTWLHRITVNTAVSYLRKPRRLAFDCAPLLDKQADTQVKDPAVTLHGQAMVRRLYNLLDQISPKRRVAFTLFFIEGLSIKEVAETTGVVVSVAKSRIWFAKREVKKRAGDDIVLADIINGLDK